MNICWFVHHSKKFCNINFTQTSLKKKITPTISHLSLIYIICICLSKLQYSNGKEFNEEYLWTNNLQYHNYFRLGKTYIPHKVNVKSNLISLDESGNLGSVH